MSRFGAQARDDVTVVEKCIIARVKIIDDQGKTVGIRHVHDKYVSIRCVPCLILQSKG